jgi:hypothetical protein
MALEVQPAAETYWIHAGFKDAWTSRARFAASVESISLTWCLVSPVGGSRSSTGAPEIRRSVPNRTVTLAS